jgi:hypothetical protein
VQLSPSLDKPSLRAWQLPGQKLDRVDTEHSYMLLIVSVEVRRVVRLADLHKHADDDPEEAAEFGHDRLLYPAQRLPIRTNARFETSHPTLGTCP